MGAGVDDGVTGGVDIGLVDMVGVGVGVAGVGDGVGCGVCDGDGEAVRQNWSGPELIKSTSTTTTAMTIKITFDMFPL